MKKQCTIDLRSNCSCDYLSSKRQLRELAAIRGCSRAAFSVLQNNVDHHVTTTMSDIVFPVSQLPPELMHEVAQHVTLSQLMLMKTVCKAWKRIGKLYSSSCNYSSHMGVVVDSCLSRWLVDLNQCTKTMGGLSTNSIKTLISQRARSKDNSRSTSNTVKILKCDGCWKLDDEMLSTLCNAWKNDLQALSLKVPSTHAPHLNTNSTVTIEMQESKAWQLSCCLSVTSTP
jgi:hypothetical protein